MAATGPGVLNSRIVRWIDYRLPFVKFVQHELYEYPTPRNLSYWWNFGSLAGIMLVIMIGSGVILAMHYTPNADMAFDSVERLMRDVNYGWLLRYLHMNGASMFSSSSTSISSADSITARTNTARNCCGCSASSSCS